MNKLLILPLSAMFAVTLFMFLALAVQPEASSRNYSESSGITIDGGEKEVLIPEANTQEFDIWLVTGAMVIIVAAIAIGLVAGISFLGSGLTAPAQKLLLISFIYLSLWGCLTIVLADLMFENLTTTAIWLGLTIMFVFGMSQEMTGGDE